MGLRPDSVPDKKPHGGRWLLWLPLLLAGVVLYTLNVSSEIGYRSPVPSHFTPLFNNTSSGFMVNTPGCRIPALDPFDPLIRKYVNSVGAVHCDAKGRQLVASNLTSLFIVEDVLPDYNLTSLDQLSCCYRPFWRVEGDIGHHAHDMDDLHRFSNSCTEFRKEAVIKEEFVKVECTVDGVEMYKDFHAFIPAKPEVEKRCREAEKDNKVEPLSVLLLGIDAVSRLNFHRQMPHTLNLLQELNAIELLGYNKVGDNTFPNLVPVLSGLSEAELRKVCWPKDSAPFDNCPFIWNNYSDAGYRTGFGEDSPWMGLFNYIKVGFMKQPTDYYMRPYSKLAEDKIGHESPGNAMLCVGSRLTAEVLLEYISKFALSLVSQKSFALFWGVSLTHDFLNYPSLGDNLHVKVLTDMKKSGALDHTVLIMLSDHGIRWGEIRETYQGRMEERLPFVFFVFPTWFRDRFTAAVGNLNRNARRLTTPFDLHETLADLLHPEERLTQDAIRSRSQSLSASNPPPRGISLFLQMSEDRTCAQAGIDPHWCTCLQSQSVALNSSLVQRTAAFLVDHMNVLLKDYHQCSPLSLAAVQDAQLQVPLEHLHQSTQDKGINDYMLVVKTNPGGGVFEATIRHRPKNDSLSLAGTVSRLNAYGNQSVCVAEFHLKLYCYCAS